MKKDDVRMQSLTQLLNKKNLDGMVFFHPENVLLGSGILPASPYTICLVNGFGRVVIISPWWMKKTLQLASWADEIFTFNWLKSLEEVNPVKAICAFLNEKKREWEMENVGYDGSFACLMPSYAPSSFYPYEEMKSNLRNIFRKAVDISEDIRQLRSIKTPYEIEMLRRANFVARQAAKTFYENAHPGIREVDLAAEILRTVQGQVGKGGIKFTYCDPPQITSGKKRTYGGNAYICPATARKLKTGELVMLELGGCADGYWFDITRTLVVGSNPLPILKKMNAAINESVAVAFSTYLNTSKSGGDLTKAAFEVLDRYGFHSGIVHNLGHGVGFSYHEDRPRISLGSKDIIEPGMVTSIEPGLYLAGIGGIRIENNVLWEKDKVNVLSHFHNNLDEWSEEVS